ncbi:MAG: PHB depolymerase family esterase [Acidobacteriota bacterium]|nr:PHB depolymerase family esterase [Acidobacteriota bacterium]
MTACADSGRRCAVCAVFRRRRTLRWWWALGAVLAAWFAAGPATAGTWDEEQTLEHDGMTRYFRVYRPDFQPPEGMPLLFVLHGGGGDMRSFLDNGTHAEWPEIADEEGLLLIVPNGVDPATGDPSTNDQNWNDCRADGPRVETGADDVGFISALIDWADARYPIDPQRVYATGSSNGGLMSYRLAFELSERIAAIAPFIANLPAVSECADPRHPISVFICNGDGEETYMPWDGGCVVDKVECERGRVISAEATREYWIAHNLTEAGPGEFTAYDDLDPDDGTTAESTLYRRGYEGAEVAFYRIRNGGHVTPSIDHPRSRLVLQLLGLGLQNHDIEGSRQAWAFLSRQRLSGQGQGTAPGVAGLLRLRREGPESLRPGVGRRLRRRQRVRHLSR